MEFLTSKKWACAAAVCCAFGVSAAYADYPDRAITLVVPTAAGGGNDALARVVGQKMGDLLGQSIIVVNKPGAQGAIASDYVARQPADGYTLMLGYIGTHGINPALQKLNYDPVKDFTPIGRVADSPTIMVVSSSIGVNDVAGLVKYSKDHPDSLTFASAGAGTAPAVAGQLFNQATGANMLDIPYKGSAPALTDTLSGTTQVMFPSLFSVYPHLKSEKIRALAVAGPTRTSVLPGLPTLAEAGVPGVEVPQWYAIFAPAKADAALVQKLNTALNQALNDPEVVKKIDEQGAEVHTSTPAELGAFVQSEAVRWKKLAATTALAAR
ncbi:Bug family tripartite tricarboxylate transporter substrate binding protein [Bordetella genomosp. 4]|uniref:ABC transporter substrate-binding protein n=1 Tax=Bordetella genomosp. 4 TaxID=463044 RepID=A0A261UCN1_9BORD|nr:tripartite tricarboxylate transporter substrate binding protein [Bordetella genomosp. 4]OZI52711.1 ABC transporter substrate-binding protein [Bordetella genomosp. 4]OZI59162.1 ABC transporter substrate-binding protein [Bordetella genomosp. 4]